MATFKGDAGFTKATFERDVGFGKATFETDAEFHEATFERARTFGPVLALRTLSFKDASFLEKADLDLIADQVYLSRARFPQGANVWVRWADIILDKTEFGASSILAGSSKFGDIPESRLAEKHRLSGVRSERPRLLTMRWADVGSLTVSGIDLSPCRFFGAHHLDGLRLEGGSSFASTPTHRRVTRRQAIAEEQGWRRDNPTILSAPGWCPPECDFPEDLPRPSPLTPNDIATIYRDLRKGREQNKDEAGAADFYYGEMEMRRFDNTRSGAERLILRLYWLISGYGLRATRALIALALTVLAFGALLWWIGFSPRLPFTRSLLFSLESTSSLFRVPITPDFALTEIGELLQVVLRLLGPLFFGLALLSLRGRVKR
jgi:Pentapeptide repeats (9 copies)